LTLAPKMRPRANANTPNKTPRNAELANAAYPYDAAPKTEEKFIARITFEAEK
jgi:hypothetical protein